MLKRRAHPLRADDEISLCFKGDHSSATHTRMPAPISTSVLLSLSRSPRPRPLQNWRSSLERRSPTTKVQEFFFLLVVEKRELGITSVKGVVDDTTPIFPQFRVMPIGWTHALAICQTILSRVARVAAPLSLALKDNLRALRPEPPVLSVYVNNFATICTNAAERCTERGPRAWAVLCCPVLL